MNDHQYGVVCEIWRRARHEVPTLREPTRGFDDDAGYYMSWSYLDMPDVTLNITVDVHGRVDWFFSDMGQAMARGTEGEDGDDELAEEVYGYLKAFG